MTRLSVAVAAVLAAALACGLCLLIGVWMGRNAKPDHESRDQGYVEQHGWFV